MPASSHATPDRHDAPVPSTPPSIGFDDATMRFVREAFLYTDRDPDGGPRIFLESGGGSLVLREAVARRAALQGIPDASSRQNASAAALRDVIETGRRHLHDLFGSPGGTLVYGATGTELLFRIIRVGLERQAPGSVVSSALEHSATRDAAQGWSRAFGHEHVAIAFDPDTLEVTPEAYARAIRPDTRVATVIHTSHVSGTRVDLPAICRQIRAIAPACLIVCDGIQHAPHGPMQAEADGVDAYVYAPYKAFAPRGGAFAWVSERLARMPRNDEHGKAPGNWSLGSSDPSLYGAISAVHSYLVALSRRVAAAGNRDRPGAQPAVSDREAIHRAMQAAGHHERRLIDRLLNGSPRLPGLKDISGLRLIGRADSHHREGAVSFAMRDVSARELVDHFARHGIRVHYRVGGAGSSARHVLDPLGMADALRVSFAHYNTLAEMDALLTALQKRVG